MNPLFLIIGTLAIGYPDVTAGVLAVYVGFLLVPTLLRRRQQCVHKTLSGFEEREDCPRDRLLDPPQRVLVPETTTRG